jgi:hypothetical protein
MSNDSPEEIDWPEWFNPKNASREEKATIKHEYVEKDEEPRVKSGHDSSPNVDLPVAADAAVSKETGEIIRISGHFEGPEIEAYENEDAVLKKAVWLSDAEEAIRQREKEARSEILNKIDLEEVIDQLALAHRELQNLKDDGSDDAGDLQEKIEANRKLQQNFEELFEKLENRVLVRGGSYGG